MSKTILITGASSGIGRAAATKFASEGYTLILNCMHGKEQLQQLQSQLQHEYQVSCEIMVADISNADEVHTMFQTIFRTHETIDILLNNAGISHIGLLQDMSVEEWMRVINTNLSSAFFCSKHVIPHMLLAGHGKIVNISSVWGNIGASCEVAYSAAKGGLNSFTKALAKELAPSNIQVNAIACGVIDTRMNECFTTEERQLLCDEIPSGRFATPEETADFIFDVATTGTYYTGQIVNFDGAWQ